MSTATEKARKLTTQVKTAVDQAVQLAAGEKKTAEKIAGQNSTGYVEYTGGDRELDAALKGLSDR